MSNTHTPQTTIQTSNLQIFKLHGPASIWEYQKHVKLLQSQCYIAYIGKASSGKLRWVISYTLYRMDPQTTYKKTLTVGQRPQTSESYTARLPFESTKKVKL